MAKLLVFDVDGTLLLTGGAGTRAMADMFLERYGIKNGLEGVDGRGKTDPAIFMDVFKSKLGREPRNGELEVLIRDYPRYLKPRVETSPGYKTLGGIEEFLEAVSEIKSVRLALGTGNIEEGARIKLERAGLNRYFPVGGFSTDDILRDRLIQKGVAKARQYYDREFAPRDIFVIGDTALDIAAAKACGFVSVAVALGMARKEVLIAAGPDFCFDDYLDPDAWVKKLKLRDSMPSP